MFFQKKSAVVAFNVFPSSPFLPKCPCSNEVATATGYFCIPGGIIGCLMSRQDQSTFSLLPWGKAAIFEQLRPALVQLLAQVHIAP